jgi:hypothetical protein
MTSFGRNVTIAADGCPAALGNGVADDRAAIQAHADWLWGNGGGWLDVPAGQYKIGGNGLRLAGEVSLRGEGLNTALQSVGDNIVLTMDNSGSHRLQDVFLIGNQGLNPTQPTLVIDGNAEVYIDRIRCWYGAPALKNYGNDGTISNSFFWSRTCNVANHGSQWWKRVKFDDAVGYTPHAVYMGSGALENYFEQCDFSGNFGYSFYSHGFPDAVYKFTDCVFSSQIDINGLRWASFVGCTFGSPTFLANNCALSFSACVGLGITLNIAGNATKRIDQSCYNIL